VSDAPARPRPDVLEISLSVRGQLRPVGLLVVFLIAYPVAWATGLIPGWLAAVGAVVFATIITFGLITALRSRRFGWVLRMSASGVTVRHRGPEIPWSDLDSIAVTGMKPSWFYLVGRRRYPVVAFLPRPGVTLPALRLPGGPGPRDAYGELRERLYGTHLVLMPHAMTATADDIAATAHRWGGLPVTWYGQQRA